MALVDTLEEQALLEQVLDDSKPAVPQDCRRHHYLLFTPFRYGAAYPRGSRFRRVGLTPGVFYASLQTTTAVAEMAFWRMSSGPRNAGRCATRNRSRASRSISWPRRIAVVWLMVPALLIPRVSVVRVSNRSIKTKL